MNAERLLQLYDRVSEAPDAIPRLRRFILDLAVRGKLVEQDPGDAPARLLLKAIYKEKKRLIADGVIRNPRSLADEHEAIGPFQLPPTWLWTRLDTVGAIIGGGTPPAGDSTNFSEPGDGIPWLTPADLGGYDKEYISRGSRDLTEKGVASSSATLMPTGAVLFTSRAPIGYVAIASNPLATNQGFKSIVPYVGECSRYIAVAMRAFAPKIDASAPGTTFKEVSGKIVAGIPFPLPPLVEQHRIVAKVDELMDLCDSLEAERENREATRDRLTTASLSQLTAPDVDGKQFKAHADFAIRVLPELTTRPDQIKVLRQTILDLAARGKLVEQDPNDEPAPELIAQLAANKARLVKAGEIKRDTPRTRLATEECPFELPGGWVWTRLGNLIKFVTSGSRDWAKHYSTEGAIFVRMGNLSRRHYRLRLDQVQRVKPPADGEGTRTRLEAGDILISITGDVGMLGLIPEGFGEAYINQHTAMVRPMPQLTSRYLPELFRSSVAQAQFNEPQRGIKNSFRLTDVTQLIVPVPPLTEQHRIVAKVDELMLLCDHLEQHMVSVEEIKDRVLDVLVVEALALAPALSGAA